MAMTARLNDTYQPGDLVEILFDAEGGEQWLAGLVMGFQRPGLWVQLPEGSMWFVTNTRRIRLVRDHAGPESE